MRRHVVHHPAPRRHPPHENPPTDFSYRRQSDGNAPDFNTRYITAPFMSTYYGLVSPNRRWKFSMEATLDLANLVFPNRRWVLVGPEEAKPVHLARLFRALDRVDSRMVSLRNGLVHPNKSSAYRSSVAEARELTAFINQATGFDDAQVDLASSLHSSGMKPVEIVAAVELVTV